MAAKKKRQDPFKEIQNCLQKRNYKGALGWFQKLLDREEKNTQIRLRYADTLVLAGSKNEAIKQYRIVADELAESGFMIRAIAISKKIVKLDPRQTDVHQKLAEMNEARSKGQSAAMAQLSSAIVSDPAIEASPSPPAEIEPPQIEEPEPQIEAELQAEVASEPTMSLEDSMAMEFGAPAQGVSDVSDEVSAEAPVDEYEISMEAEPASPPAQDSPELTQPVKGPAETSDPTLNSVSGAIPEIPEIEDEELILEPIDEDEASGPLLVEEGKDVEITFDANAPGLELPGLEDASQGFEIVEEPAAETPAAAPDDSAPDIEFESGDLAPSFSEEPALENEEAAAAEVLDSASSMDGSLGGLEDESEGPDVEFDIEMEPEAAADGADPLVGVLGDDIDALIDSIIDDVGSSASAPPSPPPKSTESPGGIPLFSQLTMQEFIDVAVVLDRRSVKKGTVIVREGDPGDSMFIVSTGEVDASVEDDGKTVKVHSFKDGDFFGEMAVLTGEPRTATLTATKNTELLELSRDDLNGIFSKHPDVEAKIRLAYDERAMNPPK